MTAKVFVTQIPHRRDAETRAFVPAFNIAPATEHGELIIMMPPHASFHATNDLTRQLKKSLYDYNYEAGDSLISMGDPCIIAVACAILGRDFGKFAILKWDRQLGRYIKSHIKI